MINKNSSSLTKLRLDRQTIQSLFKERDGNNKFIVTRDERKYVIFKTVFLDKKQVFYLITNNPLIKSTR